MDIIIFGISGDLSEKKLIPAIVSLYSKAKLSDDLRVIGYSRTPKEFTLPFKYIHVIGQYDSKKDLEKMKDILRKDVKQLFYLALPASASRSVLENLDTDGKICVEKPFGQGYDDAKNLINFLNNKFGKDQILKVDHYAGKPEIRTILDREFDPKEISEVFFDMYETVDIENRQKFYDVTGALRDVGQNHILLMLSSLFSNKIRDRNIIAKLSIVSEANNKFLKYHDRPAKETFFSIWVKLNKEGYNHIEIRLSGGKCLPENKSAVTIRYYDGREELICFSHGTEAYENVFLNALENKNDFFKSNEEILAAWKFIEEVEKVRDIKGIGKYNPDMLD